MNAATATRNAERNEAICRAYINGSTLQECAKQHNLSRERIRQILRAAGIFKNFRKKTPSERDEFLGVNLSEADKKALRAEASRRGISMSSLTSDLIKEMLAALPQ